MSLHNCILTFWRLRGVGGVEVKRLVGDDGGLEGRRDLLGQELGPVDGREERMLLQRGHPLGACERTIRLPTISLNYLQIPHPRVASSTKRE